MIWVIAVLVVLGAFALLDQHFDSRKWRKWPTMAEYLREHPQARTADGVKCFCCDARNISTHVAVKHNPDKRLHRCDSCSTWLYRNEG